MKRESDKQKLIADLLTNDSDLRDSTLQHGLLLSRRKRQRRRVAYVSLWIVPFAIVAATVLLQLRHEPKRSADIPVGPTDVAINSARQTTPRVIEGTSVRIISDAELLDLFKGRPVAL